MRQAALLVLVAAVGSVAGAGPAYPNHGHGNGHGRGHGRGHEPGHHGHGHGHGRTGSIVWVQTNEPGGNRILVYDRNADGTLSQAGAYATGGNGGVAAPGTE